MFYNIILKLPIIYIILELNKLKKYNLNALNSKEYKYVKQIIILLFPIIALLSNTCILCYIFFLTIYFKRPFNIKIIHLTITIYFRVLYLLIFFFPFTIIEFIKKYFLIKSNKLTNAIIFLIILIPLLINVLTSLPIINEFYNLNQEKLIKILNELNQKYQYELNFKQTNEFKLFKQIYYFLKTIKIDDNLIKHINLNNENSTINKNNKINKISLLKYIIKNKYSNSLFVSIYKLSDNSFINNILGIKIDKDHCYINKEYLINNIIIKLLENKIFSLEEFKKIFDKAYNKAAENNKKGLKSYIPYNLLSILYTDNYKDSFKIILLFYFIYYIEIIKLILLIISYFIITEYQILSPIKYIDYFYKIKLNKKLNENSILYLLYIFSCYIFSFIITLPITPLLINNLFLIKFFAFIFDYIKRLYKEENILIIFKI